MTNNNQNSETIKTRVSRIVNDILCIVRDILIAICRAVVRTLLWVARNVWKRYFNIETPVYKLWWSAHSESMQKKLDLIHKY